MLLFLFEKKEGSLKEQISNVKPVLEDLLMKKELRLKDLSETMTQIEEISSNIAGNDYPVNSGPEIDESDLTQRKLDELRAHLKDLLNEKVFLYFYIHVKYLFQNVCGCVLMMCISISGCSIAESKLLYQCCL